MFEKASRLKLRFVTLRGLASAEDLWDMPLASKDGFNLDEVAIHVNNALKAQSESFVAPKTDTESEMGLRLEILKYIIAVKLRERKEREDVLSRKAKKEHILAIIKDKQDEVLKSKSIDELEKELDAL